jgi:hypothetical protein
MSKEFINILYWNIGLRTEDKIDKLTKKIKTPRNSDNIKNVLHALSKAGLMLCPDVIFLADFSKNHHKQGMIAEVVKLMPWGYEPFFPPNFAIYQARPIVVFYKTKTILLSPRPELTRKNFSVCYVSYKGRRDRWFQLIPVHFRSKVGTNTRGREVLIEDDVKELLFFASLFSETTFIFGDFNNNPWDEVMFDPRYFSSGFSYQCPKDSKKVAFPKLYNPTWALLGDFVQGSDVKKPVSSYYYDKIPVSHHYNMFEQLLMPFDTIPHFYQPGLQLIDQVTGCHQLWDYEEGKPNIVRYADHLPLFFQIKISP